MVSSESLTDQTPHPNSTTSCTLSCRVCSTKNNKTLVRHNLTPQTPSLYNFFLSCSKAFPLPTDTLIPTTQASLVFRHCEKVFTKKIKALRKSADIEIRTTLWMLDQLGTQSALNLKQTIFQSNWRITHGSYSKH